MANEEAGSGPFWGKPEWRGEEGYYKMLASSFADLISSGEDANRYLRYIAYIARDASGRKTTGTIVSLNCSWIMNIGLGRVSFDPPS